MVSQGSLAQPLSTYRFFIELSAIGAMRICTPLSSSAVTFLVVRYALVRFQGELLDEGEPLLLRGAAAVEGNDEGLVSLDRCVHVLGSHVAAMHHAARHALAVARVAFHVHGRRLEH